MSDQGKVSILVRSQGSQWSLSNLGSSNPLDLEIVH